MIEHGVKQPT